MASQEKAANSVGCTPRSVRGDRPGLTMRLAAVHDWGIVAFNFVSADTRWAVMIPG